MAFSPSCLCLICFLLTLALSNAFSPCRNGSRCRTTLRLAVDMPPIVVAAPNSQMLQQQQQPLMQGIQVYTESMSSDVRSTSLLVSLVDRKIPTQEEIDQKKLTFNLIFWGGGFVAPFAATVFYFGFKFWEK